MERERERTREKERKEREKEREERERERKGREESERRERRLMRYHTAKQCNVMVLTDALLRQFAPLYVAFVPRGFPSRLRPRALCPPLQRFGLRSAQTPFLSLRCVLLFPAIIQAHIRVQSYHIISDQIRSDQIISYRIVSYHIIRNNGGRTESCFASPSSQGAT